MAGSKRPQHYVCTPEEAREIAGKHDRYWISTCGCRKRKKGGCEQSRADVCLSLREKTPATRHGAKAVDRTFVDGIFTEAKEKRLVPRPFRDAKGVTEGICFCCDDCCSYFTKIGKEACDKGKMIESTNAATCINCGTCVDACRFEARAFDGELKVDAEKCYGCGVCADACPDNCITMVKRT